MKLRSPLILSVFLMIGLGGCTPTREITYDLKDVALRDSTSAVLEITRRIVLDIEPFEDIRQSVPGNDLLFVRERETNIDEKHSCINSEQHYKKGTVADQVAAIIAAHFEKRKSFKNVLAKNNGAADYYLTGKLKRLYGQQEFSTSAQIGSFFGLIGAIATSGAKTNGSIAIEFSELVLHHKSDAKEKPLENFSDTFSGDLHADANCWAIYENVNSQLKTAVGKLAPKIEQAIAELESPKP
ncbi:MAG TPA: hypothetical protein VES59_04905 [Bacteroidota bacterium]|nr:hypothetical protein [Bacteroidota bacterium]